MIQSTMAEDIRYKEFNEEEERIYKQCIGTIRLNISNGALFDTASEAITVEDQELKNLIVDDALKIEIAEMHYGKGLPLSQVSEKLGVSIERLFKANAEMIEDVANTSGRHELDTRQ